MKHENSSQFQVTGRLQAVLQPQLSWSLSVRLRPAQIIQICFSKRNALINPGFICCLFLIYVNAWYRKLCKNWPVLLVGQRASFSKTIFIVLSEWLPRWIVFKQREKLQLNGKKSPINESTLSLFLCHIHGLTNSTPGVYLIKLRLWLRHADKGWDFLLAFHVKFLKYLQVFV